MTRGVALCSVALSAALAGCSSPPAPRMDGWPSLILEILDPPGSQLGLHYGQTAELRVRYREDTPEETPAGGEVRFAIFDDPGGSTLSSDRVSTGGDGVASVTLTAGAAERSFRVRASANNASDVEFAISISQLAFVDLDVHLNDPVSTQGSTLSALLYEGKLCTELRANSDLPSPGRRVQRTRVSDATLTFFSLLSRDYTVVGLAQGEGGGQAHATGCAELGAALLPPGSRSSFSLPLQVVPQVVTGTYALSTMLSTSAEADGVLVRWRPLACPRGAATQLLDLISPQLPMGLSEAVDDRRAAADEGGCRAADFLPGSTSLDAEIEALLDVPTGVATALPGIVADVTSFVTSAELDSRLVIGDGGGGLLWADHTLEQVLLSDSSTTKWTYPLNPLGLPLLQSSGVGVTLKGQVLHLEAQAFTLGLPIVWKTAIEEAAIHRRFPSLSPPLVPALVTSLFGVASYEGKSGCAAVEARLCESVSSSECVGVVTPACDAALEELAIALGSDFVPPNAVDLELAGRATVVDSNDDLSIDALKDGVWDLLSATFTGTKTP